jgi:hypothetical protein
MRTRTRPELVGRTQREPSRSAAIAGPGGGVGAGEGTAPGAPLGAGPGPGAGPGSAGGAGPGGGGGAGEKKIEAVPWSELAPTSARGAPATIVSPATATEEPSRSPAAPSGAVSLAVSVRAAAPLAAKV